ncbi:MAG: HPr family phosphocarrier protein [Lachnospiraceae bacterium]|jgi:catabolite repression HPr-like protein|nr:HPr family phosphocarrier protein [Lachnospiraceae bacterium]MBO7650875.1 HPr family phosphocarrier protein [Lachnospiraceae bacterium]MBR7000412.1 HPr family phosphocarrier protein [Lachnospiraceae bacterium]MCR5530910.1 HPr family phosphocarrier protein [Lachnospiraceae bacterium]
MISKNITISIPSGLEARPVALLVQVASRYDSSIYVECGNKKVNAKSIMGMMSLAIPAGTDITVTVDGPDEEAAMKGIENFLADR